MRKEIKYETNKIEDVFIDLADEIKNGWRICCFHPSEFHITLDPNPKMEFEVGLCKEIKYE